MAIRELSDTDSPIRESLRGRVLTYSEYMQNWRNRNEQPMKGLGKDERRMRHYSIYNLERQIKVEQDYTMSDAFREAVLHLEGPQRWLFITDDWCIDSAYSLPLLMAASALRNDVSVLILMKEDHLPLLDAYLTAGRRSIPILIAVDSRGVELFHWGPQPAELTGLRTSLQEAGEPGRVVSGATVDWYADDGHLAVEKELTRLFRESRRQKGG